MREEPLAFVKSVAQLIFDKKGFNIMAIDVRDVSTMADFFLIAEGNVSRHVSSMGEAILELKKDTPSFVEGLGEGEWVVIDYLYVVIHLFTPPFRDKYRLEELWHEGKIIDLNLRTSQEKGCAV